MKLKTGEQITTKEFMSRWKKGIQEITPYQQSKISLVGSCFMIIGVITGLITTFILKTWWLFIILCGSFLLVGVGTIANYQKYIALQKINNLMEGGEYEEQQSTS